MKIINIINKKKSQNTEMIFKCMTYGPHQLAPAFVGDACLAGRTTLHLCLLTYNHNILSIKSITSP